MTFLSKFGTKVEMDKTVVRELINHPFYENRSGYFKNKDWEVFQLENDFFIEEPNYELLCLLMTKAGESSFMLCNAHSFGKVDYYQLDRDIDLKEIRLFVDENQGYFVMDWYIFSESKKWACIVEYDDDSLYLGVERGLSKDLKISERPNFVKQLLVEPESFD